MKDYRAWGGRIPAFPVVLEVMVGKFGVGIRIPAGGIRSHWYIFRPSPSTISGPFGTRVKARKLLSEPIHDTADWAEPRWGREAAQELEATQ